MPNATSWLQEFHGGMDKLRSAQITLQQVSTSLHRVGMTKLADEIDQSLIQLQGGADQMRSAVHNKIDEDLKEAQNMSGELLRAILDGRIDSAVTRFRAIMKQEEK